LPLTASNVTLSQVTEAENIAVTTFSGRAVHIRLAEEHCISQVLAISMNDGPGLRPRGDLLCQEYSITRPLTASSSGVAINQFLSLSYSLRGFSCTFHAVKANCEQHEAPTTFGIFPEADLSGNSCRKASRKAIEVS